MMTLDVVLRITTFTLLFLRILYWLYTANKANSLKPKQTKLVLSQKIKDYILYLLWGLLGIQLAGLSLFPVPYSMSVQSLGLVIVVTGVVIFVGNPHLSLAKPQYFASCILTCIR